MANFESMSQLQTNDSAGGLGATTLSVPDFQFRGKAREDDFMSQLDKMTKAMREQQEAQQTELRLDVLDMGSGLADESISTESLVDKLLREAKQLIAQEQYAEAVEPLFEVLKENPSHHEALYLLAFCQVQLNDYESALRTLLPLRQARLENTLASRVSALRAEIRAVMSFAVVFETFLLMQTGLYDMAITRLRDVVNLDPEVGIYHFMLAGSLMSLGQFDQAIAATSHGLRSCASGDREMLVGLKRQIEEQYVVSKMAPARELFKKGSYGRARSVLNRVEPAYRQIPLYVTFAGYLARLDGGMLSFFKRKNPTDAVPPGSRNDVEAFYFFLIGEELDLAKQLIAGQDYLRAQGVLYAAIKHTPDFPFAHYLCAGCIYSRVSEQITGDTPPDLEEVISELESARRHARIGAADTEINDASDLQTVIDETHKQLCTFREERKARQVEIKLVNDAIEEFQAIMKMADNGITSSSHYQQINDRLTKLKKTLPGLKKKVRDDAAEAIKQLTEAVDRNLEQLRSLADQIGEGDTVKKHYDTFNLIMQSLNDGGITSYQARDSLVEFFRSLKTNIEADKKKLRSAEGKKSLSELAAAIDQVIKQLVAL